MRETGVVLALIGVLYIFVGYAMHIQGVNLATIENIER